MVLRKVTLFEYGRAISRASLVEGRSYIQMTEIANKLQKGIDVFDIFHCDQVLRYYLLCVLPEYRKMGTTQIIKIDYFIDLSVGLGMNLFDVAIDVARMYQIPVVIHFSDHAGLKNVAQRVQMEVNSPGAVPIIFYKVYFVGSKRIRVLQNRRT